MTTVTTWTISHGGPTVTRDDLRDLNDHIDNVVEPVERRAIRRFLKPPKGHGTTREFNRDEAGQIYLVLHANAFLVPPQYRQMSWQIAAAARRAYDAGQPLVLS